MVASLDKSQEEIRKLSSEPELKERESREIRNAKLGLTEENYSGVVL
jgi:hypothetical protein